MTTTQFICGELLCLVAFLPPVSRRLIHFISLILSLLNKSKVAAEPEVEEEPEHNWEDLDTRPNARLYIFVLPEEKRASTFPPEHTGDLLEMDMWRMHFAERPPHHRKAGRKSVGS